MITSPRMKWFGLALLGAVQFMVVLDIAIVNVALPSIQTDLGFSQANLQWVISAYALVFGGFLLLGGRTADLLGRRRVFMVGLVLFTIGSLLCGLAWDETSLIGARAIQGLGAATISPAALAILMTTFAEGRERNIALGVWGAVGGFGAAAGVLLGGVLTDALSWEWIFFVNIPVGLAAVALAPVLLKESRDTRVKSFDALGAVLVTSGLTALVLAITQGNEWGWGSGRTLGVFALSAALLVGFVVWENRVAEPLMRFGLLRTKTVLGANVSGFILGTALFSMFLILTLYMQQVLGYSAMKTGVAYLAVAGTSIIWANVAAAMVGRVGVRPLIAGGMALLALGMILFAQIPVDGSYVADLLPGFLIIALGMALCFVPISIAALAGVSQAEAGIASGLINTSQQIGGAVGIALLSSIAISRTENEIVAGTAPARSADVRLPARVLGRCRHRARRRRRGARADPAGGDRACRRGGRGSRRLERRQQLQQLCGAVDHDVGGLAQLRRPLGRGDRDPDAELERPDGVEGVEVGRVVARVEPPLEAALSEQVRDRGALVGADRRSQLEHLAPEPSHEPFVAGPRRDGGQHRQRLLLVLRPAVVEADRERLPLDVVPVDAARRRPAAARSTPSPPARARGRARRRRRARRARRSAARRRPSGR